MGLCYQQHLKISGVGSHSDTTQKGGIEMRDCLLLRFFGIDDGSNDEATSACRWIRLVR